MSRLWRELTTDDRGSFDHGNLVGIAAILYVVLLLVIGSLSDGEGPLEAIAIGMLSAPLGAIAGGLLLVIAEHLTGRSLHRWHWPFPLAFGAVVGVVTAFIV